MRTRRSNSPHDAATKPGLDAGFSARTTLLGPVQRRVERMASRLKFWVAAIFVLGFAASSHAAITGQWSFESGDLTFSAKIGQSMDYRDFAETPFDTLFGTTASFGIGNIGGQSVPVMFFPATILHGGFTVPHGAAANGAGVNVNQYTIIMDIYYPGSSSGKPRALFQTDVNAVIPEASFEVDSQNRIGTAGGFFSGTATLTQDTWHRVAFAVDLTIPSVAKFIDGVKVDESDPGAGRDGRWSLNGSVLYFDSDDQNDPTQTASGYLSSMQFRDERVSDELIVALGGPTSDGIPSGPLPNPYVSSVVPSPTTVIIPARSTVPPKPLIQAIIIDGTNAVDPATVTLTLNSQSVTPTVNKMGDTTTVSFTPTTLLGPLSTNAVQITFKGLDGTSFSRSWQFVVGIYTLIPAGDAPGSANTPGFLVRTVQAPADAVAGIPNPVLDNLTHAIEQLNGTLTDTGGVLVADVSIPGPNPDGSYDVDTINFHLNGTSYGFFPGDAAFPGIPGSEGTTDVFASEILTFLELTAGVHHLGFSVTVDRTDVASDDGYALFSGSNPRNFLNPILGQFFRGNVPAFASVNNSNVFTVVAPADGVYPMRLTYYQTHEDASLEWFSIDEGTGDKILINDSADARAIKAFRFSTAASENKPYVAQIDPTPGISGVSPLLPISVLIIDDQTHVALNSIQLSLNGTVVPATATRTSGRTTVTYQPNATRTDVTNKWHLVYADDAIVPSRFTNDWQFSIAVNTGVVTPVAGQWDFNNCDLSATVGKPLLYFDGPAGQTAAGTAFGTCSSLGVSLINGQDARIMRVPGAIGSQYGYIMDHGIAPNGGGTKVNQYTIIFDVMVDDHAPDGSGAASLIQISSPTLNNDDGDLFWQGNNFGQGGGGYNGKGTFTTKAWHRVVAAYDEAANPPVVTKYVDGIKQDDWTANQGLDAPRRALQPTAILFGEGDGDERRVWWVSSIQIRSGKMADAEIAALGGPSSSKIPIDLPSSSVAGQWDFEFGDLSATVGKPLQYFDGPAGQTVAGTVYGTCTSLGVSLINGADANIMQVPGAIGSQYGYIMSHGIAPNGGGSKVNQYTIIFDIMVDDHAPDGSGAASLIQISSPTLNNDDGDLFWQGNNFGQGGGGYNGRGTFTTKAWHRVAAAYDEAASPPVVTKYVDGIKQDDWTANQGLDAPRRALQPTAILFGEGDGDERRVMWVSSIQISAGKMTDAQLAALGGPSASKIPIATPNTTVAGQWDFEFGDLSATAGKPLQYFDGPAGQTVAGTVYGTCSALGVSLINGVDAKIMQVPGAIGNQYGYIMSHGIPPNGGGTKVNQYTILFDIMVDDHSPDGSGAASLIQISSPTLNNDDGDLFWQGNNFGQGGGGYNGTGIFTAKAWHRVIAAYDEAAHPPVVTKFVDGIKQDDWTANQALDAPRRALQPTAILFGEGDGDERRVMWVDSIQIRAGKLSDADMIALGGPSGTGLPIVVPAPASAAPAAKISAHRSGNTLQLSWPLGLTGYILESTPSLKNPNWQPVAGTTANCANVPANVGNQFYRLRQP